MHICILANSSMKRLTILITDVKLQLVAEYLSWHTDRKRGHNQSDSV